jgi:hypothetical protein
MASGSFHSKEYRADFFPPETSWDPQLRRHVTAITITCSKCGRKAGISVTGRHPPLEACVKKFHHLGWAVGTTRKTDICPACIKKTVKATIAAAKTTNVIPMQTQKDAPMTVTQLAPPPPQPSKTDKRVIILKLEDCYLGEDKGYDAGHSDASVAKELNVPAKWVADVREELFGPALDPEAVKINGEIMALHVRFVALEKELREAGAKLNDLKARIAKR